MSERCAHEPYQGRCIHCDVPFVNGAPKEPSMSEREREAKWVLVPVEAPDSLLDTMSDVFHEDGTDAAYTAMLAARPPIPDDVWEQMVERLMKEVNRHRRIFITRDVASAWLRAALDLPDE